MATGLRRIHVQVNSQTRAEKRLLKCKNVDLLAKKEKKYETKETYFRLRFKQAKINNWIKGKFVSQK